MKFVLLLVLLSSCVVVFPEQSVEEVPKVQAKCVEVETPKPVKDYYICTDPYSVCWVGEAGGLSCMPQ